MKTLPTMLAIPLVALAACGEGGATPTADTTTREVTSLPAIPKSKDTPGPHPRFFFYLDAEGPARRAEAVLSDAGYQVQTSPPGDGIKEWSVIASGDPDAPDIATAEDEGFIPLAEELGGEYDGNEIPVG
jgi:hypothetical protein